MKKLLIPIVFLAALSISANAQEKSKREIKGDKYTFVYSYDKAINSYTRATQLSIDGQRKLAECYYKINQNEQSEKVYSKIVNEQVGVIPEDYYNYAMVLKSNGKYDESSKWMAKFYEVKPTDLRAIDYKEKRIDQANLLADDGKYKVQHMNVNSKAEDFGTSYYNDKIVFASSRSAKLCPKKYNWNGQPFYDLYVCEVKDGQLNDPKNFSKKINGKLHDGPASFSNNGTYMAFTKNNRHDKSLDKVVETQIYFSNYSNGKWSKPEPFAHNNTNYSVGQPCLNPSGKIMYFVSNMAGGYGGSDIYRVSKNEEGVWGRPENLGDKVNTEGDEMFPYYDEINGLMFFASDGRYGIGGLDIFISELNGSIFENVRNAGYPLNTQFDDFAFIGNDKLTKGYFSSNRTGGSGGDDIYAVDILKGFGEKGQFLVNSPENIPTERRVRETFPIRNYIFFDLNSTEIPDRYVLLTKSQVKDFKEDQLEVFTPKKLSGRSARQMVAYYNVINILGDRLGKNPNSKIKLVGSSEKGPDDALLMANNVKKYLVDVFGIDVSRIIVEGRFKPVIPSEQLGRTTELELVREGDRRVSIESSSSELLMEFQSGPNAPLKPVEINVVQEAPIESYITFEVKGAADIYSSWSLEIKDKAGKVQFYGPYKVEKVSMPGKIILGTRTEGNFLVTMIGQTKRGMTLVKDTTVHMVLWTPPKREEGMRFSIIFEFNDSKAISIYNDYLTDIVTPKIPNNGKVLIHGHTDIIGDSTYNQNLSVARANEVKEIIKMALVKAGRTDVKIEVHGFGENDILSPFENGLPEERFYNRTVIIDILPPK